MPLRGVLLLLLLSRSDVKTTTQDNTMSDNDNIRIPDLTSFVIHSITIRRGLAKEIIAKRKDHQALYYISYNHGISLQAVGYLSRCSLEEIERASATHQL